MKPSPRLLSLATAALAALASLPALAMQPFTADYRASFMGLQANGVMTLAAENNGKWRYTLQVKNHLAELSQSTLFDEQQGRLRPLSSHDLSAVPFKRRAVDARYDWSRNQATWSGDVKPDRSGPVPLQAGDMDGLLINLAIARDVTAGKPLNYRMVDGGRVKTLSYRVIGKENMTVGGKTVETTKVSRVDGNKEQIAWVAPNMPVPVRLLQREDGQNSLDLTIKSLR